MKKFKEFIEEVDSTETRSDVAKRKFEMSKEKSTSISVGSGSAVSKGGARFFSTKKSKKVEND
tara:strand:- start:154 stop:342 length:189 start_codon:yes stop_codon:yes gene_type:complete